MAIALRRPFIAPIAGCLLLFAASCGGDDAEGSSDTATSAPTQPAATAGDNAANDDAASNDEGESAPVCDLLTDEEIARTVGYEVVSKEASLMALPTCTWVLDVPDNGDTAMISIPEISMVVLPEDEYRFRTDPVIDILTPVEGVGDEAYLGFVDNPAEGVPSMVQFYALDGDQGFLFMPGVSTWENADAASADLTELGTLIFDRL